MLEEELKLNNAIAEFIKSPQITSDELMDFLMHWVVHPDDYIDFTARVVRNLATLNVKLLNELESGKRWHLVKSLCMAVEIAFSIKQWEFMLGRDDGASYWDGYPLFFSSLHCLVPSLNTLQRHISSLEQGFTGRVICLEGASERSFLDLLHLGSRLLQFDNTYFVYGGKGAHQNLVLYVKDKNEKGVRVDLAYDGDSNFTNQIDKLQQQVTIRRVFRFERDFEAAFPPEMLARAVTEYLKRFKDESQMFSVEDVRATLADPTPFVKVVEARFSISVNKPKLAEFLAVELLKMSDIDDKVLQGEGLIAGTELSRFLRFVMDWPEEIPIDGNAPETEIMFDQGNPSE
jgi:hypothetical protein